MEYLELIENLLEDNGISIEDYLNPEKGLSRYEAIENEIMILIKDHYKLRNIMLKEVKL